MHYPQTQSTPLTNMVAEINAAIGVTYFKIDYNAPERTYILNITDAGKHLKKYNYLAHGQLLYTEMFSYLNGILGGIRLAKDKFRLK